MRRSEGLTIGHAYTVLDVVADAFGSGHNLIKLRNPHAGEGLEWQGAWSDQWPGWSEEQGDKGKSGKNNGELRERLGLEAKHDGVFWMSEADFFERCGDVFVGLSSKS